MTEDKYQKRLGFKTSIKSAWTYTAWFHCGRWEMPYNISNLISLLEVRLDYELIIFKIEGRTRKNSKANKK